MCINLDLSVRRLEMGNIVLNFGVLFSVGIVSWRMRLEITVGLIMVYKSVKKKKKWDTSKKFWNKIKATIWVFLIGTLLSTLLTRFSSLRKAVQPTWMAVFVWQESTGEAALKKHQLLLYMAFARNILKANTSVFCIRHSVTSCFWPKSQDHSISTPENPGLISHVWEGASESHDQECGFLTTHSSPPFLAMYFSYSKTLSSSSVQGISFPKSNMHEVFGYLYGQPNKSKNLSKILM